MSNLIQFPSELLEKDSQDTSIYQYRKGYNLQLEPPKRLIEREELFEEIIEKSTLGELSIIEKEIMKALYLFKWLNRRNLERYLNNLSNIPQRMKKPNYRSNISRLKELGIIITFTRQPVFAGEETTLVLYRLAAGAYDYMNMYSGLKKTYEKDKNDIYIDTARALEILSLNQWYISVAISKTAKKAFYRAKFKHDGGYAMVEAAFTFDVEKEKYGNKQLMIYAFSMPKKEDGGSEMLNRLLYLNRYLQSNEAPSPASIIVTICESATRMKDAYASIRAYKELDNLDLLFVLDEDVIRGTGIDRLYTCNYNKEIKGITYTTTKIDLYVKPEKAGLIVKNKGN